MRIITTLLLCLLPSLVFAWGERGHDLVTRLAVKQLQSLTSNNDALTIPFEKRDHLLSHLSNAPDFSWRSRQRPMHLRSLNYPTHFIGMEHIYPSVKSVDEIDRSIDFFYYVARSNGVEDPAELGTAPWRVLQLHRLVIDALTLAKAAEERRDMIDAANQALFYAGLMSHFVGDLANPHHTTKNHDGQFTGNKGLHAYFEDDVVRALPMTLAGKAEKAMSTSLDKVVLANYSKEDRAAIKSDPSKLIFALVLDSHSKVNQLHGLDDKYSIITRSEDGKTRAVRKPAKDVAGDYEEFIVERLAAGAAVLGQLWLLAWEAAGQPDMSEFHSYQYFETPDFVAPDYLQSSSD